MLVRQLPTVAADAQQEAAAHNAGTKLLSLPGEIRNNIYAFCTELGPIYLGRDSKILQERRRQYKQVSGKPQFSALAQVCKQLRNEFHPLYMEHTESWIILPDLPRFMDDFLRDPNPVTNLVVDVSIEGEHLEDLVDIMPLLRKRKESPGIVCRFNDYYPRQRSPIVFPLEYSGLNELFIDIDNSSEWASFLETGLGWLLVGANPTWRPRVRIGVNPHYWTNWKRLHPTCTQQYFAMWIVYQLAPHCNLPTFVYYATAGDMNTWARCA